MSFTADTGEHKTSRSDIWMVTPTALVVDWRKNLSRNGQEPPLDDDLIALARDMRPKQGQGDNEDGTSGQLAPILCRPLPDRRLEVIGGFRRMRAALWLIESGTCPDFKVKYTVSRMSDAEAALANMCENMQREAPSPVQMAHAIRALTEDYGMSFKAVAGRLKRSEGHLHRLLELVTLPSEVQASVESGETSVAVALEVAKLPRAEQVAIFDAAAESGEVVTVEVVKTRRRAVQEATGKGAAVGRNMKQVKAFLECHTGAADGGRALAECLLEYLNGKVTDEAMDRFWDLSFERGDEDDRSDADDEAAALAAVEAEAAKPARRRKTG